MTNDHGQMQWTGKVDTEEYALFECAQCDRIVGLKPGAPKPKFVTKGNFFAMHQAWITPNMWGLWGMQTTMATAIPSVKGSISVAGEETEEKMRLQ